eukprot:CAMPEP_0119260226 /NCGR_PEP_ID=MMETSP1329-20130426/715_1 /TAXON_ID=114041 /ORGANISM="Genus nov. species nov., Strain RCC1024" /LENGTH=324 /DNA_ID=CAMNT_0007259647 /DNA_START=140 /DNA_END=1114 /DNA_ORIENTATION=+
MRHIILAALARAAAHATKAAHLHRPTLWVCSNRWCRDRGAGQTMGAALGVSKPRDLQVVAHNCFGRCTEGPNAAAATKDGTVLEFHRVDSVEKVAHILRNHLGLEADPKAARCLELHFLADAAQKRGDPEAALRLYSAALDTGHRGQRGPLLAGRAGCRLALARDRRRRVLARASGDAARRVLQSASDAHKILLLAVAGPRDQPIAAPDFSLPACAALLRDDAARACPEDVEAPLAHDGAMADFLVRGALADAAAAAAALPAYALGWRRLAQSLDLLGFRDDSRAFEEVADRVAGLADEPPGPGLVGAMLDGVRSLVPPRPALA